MEKAPKRAHSIMRCATSLTHQLNSVPVGRALWWVPVLLHAGCEAVCWACPWQHPPTEWPARKQASKQGQMVRVVLGLPEGSILFHSACMDQEAAPKQ
eukprot:114387-Pelagomonas_calceolata.AAC.3